MRAYCINSINSVYRDPSVRAYCINSRKGWTAAHAPLRRAVSEVRCGARRAARRAEPLTVSFAHGSLTHCPFGIILIIVTYALII